jgi:GntR family transcriptional regulator, vanillate catabolism transcriptional regulator
MNDVTTPPGSDAIQVALQRIARRSPHRLEGDTPAGKAGTIIFELERRLVSGRYRFGEALSINSLTEEFDASRQPVSTAINHLRSLGYVTVVPQVGCRVVSPSPTEIGDFFYMLAKIESAIAGLASVRHTTEEVAILSAIAAQIAASPFDDPTHREVYAAAVDAYHEQIRSMARSPALTPRVSNLWRLSNFYLWQGAANFAPPKANVANTQRIEIVEALRQRQVERAERLMEAHVRGKPQRVGIV